MSGYITPWVITWFVTVLSFAILVPNYFLNVGPKTAACADLKVFRMPDSTGPCPTVTVGEYLIHVAVFALVFAIILAVLYASTNKRIIDILTTAKQAIADQAQKLTNQAQLYGQRVIGGFKTASSGTEPNATLITPGPTTTLVTNTPNIPNAGPLIINTTPAPAVCSTSI